VPPRERDALFRHLSREKLRRSSRSSLLDFTCYTKQKYRPAPVHRFVCEQLERVERGEVDRLMLLEPPRHGKSELASRKFPAYSLGRNPEREIISASAGASLANEFGREVRNLIDSKNYQEVFETRLAEDAQAKGHWSTGAGGSYISVGVGSKIMGRGANIVLLDDLFGSMAEAKSEKKRGSVWEWYVSTIYNRLQPRAAIVNIGHRMHEDDFAGMALQMQAAGGDSWTVVELPALARPTIERPDPLGRLYGEALWASDFPVDAIERIRRVMAGFPQDFEALYQQNPTPEEGIVFKSAWLFPYIHQLPDLATLAVYGASDYAVTAGGGDFTVHVVVGVDPMGQIWLLDVWRGQTDSAEWVESFCDLVKLWRPIAWAEEGGQIKSGVGPFLIKRMREREAYVERISFPSRQDKRIRSQSIRGYMAVDGLYVPIMAPWYPEFKAELLAFDSGKYDDQVDALSLIGQLLDRMGVGREIPTPLSDKTISTVPGKTTATLEDMFAANERGTASRFSRIR
jgi:predicted phage terminase large subunit-like protein